MIFCLIYINQQQSFASLSLMSIALRSYLNIYGQCHLNFSLKNHKMNTKMSTKVCLHHRHAVLCHKQSCHILLLKLIGTHFETNKFLAFISSVRRLFLSEGYNFAPLIIRELPSNIHPTNLLIFVLMSSWF